LKNDFDRYHQSFPDCFEDELSMVKYIEHPVIPPLHIATAQCLVHHSKTMNIPSMHCIFL